MQAFSYDLSFIKNVIHCIITALTMYFKMKEAIATAVKKLIYVTMKRH